MTLSYAKTKLRGDCRYNGGSDSGLTSNSPDERTRCIRVVHQCDSKRDASACYAGWPRPSAGDSKLVAPCGCWLQPVDRPASVWLICTTWQSRTAAAPWTTAGGFLRESATLFGHVLSISRDACLQTVFTGAAALLLLHALHL